MGKQIRNNEEKTLAIEKMYQKVKVQVDNLSEKKQHAEKCFQVLKKRHCELKCEAERKIDELEDIIESSKNEANEIKHEYYYLEQENKQLREDNEKCKKLLEQKLRENFKFQQSHVKEQAK